MSEDQKITDQIVDQWVSFIELAEAMAQVMGVKVSEAARVMLKARQRMTDTDITRWKDMLEKAGKTVQ